MALVKSLRKWASERFVRNGKWKNPWPTFEIVQPVTWHTCNSNLAGKWSNWIPWIGSKKKLHFSTTFQFYEQLRYHLKTGFVHDFSAILLISPRLWKLEKTQVNFVLVWKCPSHRMIISLGPFLNLRVSCETTGAILLLWYIEMGSLLNF